MESMTDTNAHPSSRRYPPEIKERAVRMVQETMERNGNDQGVVSRVARQLGIGVESLRAWVRQAEIDRGTRAGLTSEERVRMRELERENKELRRANEILKSAAAFFGRSSTAAPASEPLHRGQSRHVRGRADLPGPGGRPVVLLRGPLPASSGEPSAIRS